MPMSLMNSIKKKVFQLSVQCNVGLRTAMSYSKWNMAGKTNLNLSTSRSMQFLTGKSHLAQEGFFRLSLINE